MFLRHREIVFSRKVNVFRLEWVFAIILQTTDFVAESNLAILFHVEHLREVVELAQNFKRQYRPQALNAHTTV